MAAQPGMAVPPKPGERPALQLPLAQSVGAGAKELEEAEVAEDLELLAYFVADVGVFGVKLGEFVGVSVNIGKSEIHFRQCLHYLKHVEGPATFFNL